MDPVTTALVAAMTSGLAVGTAQVSKSLVRDAYEGLKALIVKKYGEESELVKAVNSVQAKPESPARQSLLHEEMVAVKADQDGELLSSAEKLLEQLNVANQTVVQQIATGHNIAIASYGSTASVSATGTKLDE